jgi:hypothetical protein
MTEQTSERNQPRQLPLPHLDHTTPLPHDLPIAGGWGYSQEDACVITDDRQPHESDDSDEPVGLDFEFEFIERRLIEELNAMPLEEALAEIRWKVRTQEIERSADGTPTFDCLRVEVTAYLLSELTTLAAAECESSSESGAGTRRSLRFMNDCEFWFDVSRVKGIPDDAEFYMRIRHGRLYAPHERDT